MCYNRLKDYTGGAERMTLSKGTKLKYEFEGDTDTFTIIGAKTLRGKYLYIFIDSKNKKQTLLRNSILEGLQNGILKVV